jgi:hypothetical protein
VLTIDVPQPVPGLDWGCAPADHGAEHQLATAEIRVRHRWPAGAAPRHETRAAVLESKKPQLEGLGEKGNLGMPQFLQNFRNRSEIGLKRWSNVRRPSSGAVLSALTRRSGHSVMMLSETRVGYVIHDDAYQVVAEPFSDTQTA